MKILNIYGQEAWHTDARIIGRLSTVKGPARIIKERID